MKAIQTGLVSLLVMALIICLNMSLAHPTHAASLSTLPRSQQEAHTTSSLLLSPQCYMTLITLHGTHPAEAQCLIPGKRVNGRMQIVGPDTRTTGCININRQAHLLIHSISNGAVCFKESGYLAIKLDGIYDLNSCFLGGCSDGWVRVYNHDSGNVYYYNAPFDYGCHNINSAPFCGSGVEITQVDIY